MLSRHRRQSRQHGGRVSESQRQAITEVDISDAMLGLESMRC